MWVIAQGKRGKERERQMIHSANSLNKRSPLWKETYLNLWDAFVLVSQTLGGLKNKAVLLLNDLSLTCSSHFTFWACVTAVENVTVFTSITKLHFYSRYYINIYSGIIMDIMIWNTFTEHKKQHFCHGEDVVNELKKQHTIFRYLIRFACLFVLK